MPSEHLFQHLKEMYRTIKTSSEAEILHFGLLAVEADALANSAVACPLSSLIRIRVTGKDLARFLHNFCTNNIKELPAGSACEVFFTDVKARVLAHGWILATDDHHEIWMLPGDEQLLLKHLNRYIITEDVTVESLNDRSHAIAVIGPEAENILQSANVPVGETGSWLFFDGGSILRLNWNEVTTAFLTVSDNSAIELWNRLTAFEVRATPCGLVAFDHHRILEGIPLVGVDITNKNLAPEADRNSQAISYTKGCYLGQEPIARLDAMGHVTRKLCRARVAETSVVDQEEAVLVCSLSALGVSPVPALVMIRVPGERKPEFVMATSGAGKGFRLKLV